VAFCCAINRSCHWLQPGVDDEIFERRTYFGEKLEGMASAVPKILWAVRQEPELLQTIRLLTNRYSLPPFAVHYSLLANRQSLPFRLTLPFHRGKISLAKKICVLSGWLAWMLRLGWQRGVS
jgi:hypothetical protein